MTEEAKTRVLLVEDNPGDVRLIEKPISEIKESPEDEELSLELMKLGAEDYVIKGAYDSGFLKNIFTTLRST